MHKTSLILFIATIVFWGLACSSAKKTNAEQKESIESKAQAGPAVIIYKTRKDYFDKVPVTMNDDRTAIVNYPGPKDILLDGVPSYPSRLENGFLLDNRGINEHVAFLSISYDDYGKLQTAPSVDELMGLILDKEPLEVMYNCGSRFSYKNLIEELNDRISSDKLNAWKKLY